MGSSFIQKRLLPLTVFSALCLAAAPALAASSVSLGAVAGNAGSSVRVPIVLGGSAGAHALSTDLIFDRGALGVSDVARACTFSNLPTQCITNTPAKVCSDGSHSCVTDADCAGSSCNAVRLGIACLAPLRDGVVASCLFDVSSSAASRPATITNRCDLVDKDGVPFHGTSCGHGTVRVSSASAGGNRSHQGGASSGDHAGAVPPTPTPQRQQEATATSGAIGTPTPTVTATATVAP